MEYPECLVAIDGAELLEILVTMWAWPDNRSRPAAVLEGEPGKNETFENRDGAVGITKPAKRRAADSTQFETGPRLTHAEKKDNSGARYPLSRFSE